MKPTTIEQYKVVEFLKKNFEMTAIRIEPVDRYTVKVIDGTGAEQDFRCENDEVIWGDSPRERASWK